MYFENANIFCYDNYSYKSLKQHPSDNYRLGVVILLNKICFFADKCLNCKTVYCIIKLINCIFFHKIFLNVFYGDD